MRDAYQLVGGATPEATRPAGAYESLQAAMNAFDPTWDAAWVEQGGRRLAEFAWWQEASGLWVCGWRILPAGRGHAAQEGGP